MKRFIFGLIIVSVGLCVVGTCYHKKEEPKVESKIQVSAADSALFMEVLNAYLDYDDAHADSAAMSAETIGDNLGPKTAGAGERYIRNLHHVDSVLSLCVMFVKNRDYDHLLSKLESERINIYSHPGNVIDNELGLIMVYSKLYNQVYPESPDSFYTKMLPLYDFAKMHMELLEALGKGRHPFYDYIQELIDGATK